MILARTLQIGWAFLGLLIAFAAARLGRRAGAAERFPARLRRTLERLGPTFVKLGQALSQRRDLLPPSWIAELARLQETVEPFLAATAARTVEAALGRPLADSFAQFEAEPLAAASVAQVHRARLQDGREVVVKILRPGVRGRIDQDMRILLTLTRLATAVVPALQDRQTVALTRELWRNLRLETDLRVEARNIRRFVRAFAASKTIMIPDVVDGMSSIDVLVQEMSHGRRIDDPTVAPLAGRLSRAFVDFYLEQFFVVGLFHADPHPGNIFVRDDGRLCFHDFGAVGFLDVHARTALMGFMQGFIHQDAEWLTQGALDLGLVAATADRAAIARGVEAILAELAGAPLQEWSIASVMLGVARLGGGDAVVLPPHLAALVRTVFTAEGALRELDPSLDVVQTLTEGRADLLGRLGTGERVWEAGWARLKWEMALTARAAPRLVAGALSDLRDERGLALPVRLPDVSAAAGRMGRAADRVAVALVTLGLYIAASLLMQHSAGPRILGNLPVLAAIGYGLALWFTFRLVRNIDRTEGL